MWTPTVDLDEIIRQMLAIKRNQENLELRVKSLEDEVILLADRNNK